MDSILQFATEFLASVNLLPLVGKTEWFIAILVGLAPLPLLHLINIEDWKKIEDFVALMGAGALAGSVTYLILVIMKFPLPSYLPVVMGVITALIMFIGWIIFEKIKLEIE